MKQNKKRLTILSEQKYRDLYELPNFNDTDRQHYGSVISGV
jgi:hypothetical protein